MKKKVLGFVLSAAMIGAMLTGCGGASTSSTATSTATTSKAASTATTSAASTATASKSASASGKTVGVAMPTKDLQRWNQDGTNMKAELEAAGYTVDLQYASNDINQQVSQIENMVSEPVDCLVVASIDGSSLSTPLSDAKAKGIPIIAYDRLLTDTDAVDYYATFDNEEVGRIQGKYIVDQLKLADAAAGTTYNIELFTGDPGDNNAQLFWKGAITDTLQQYIDSGVLVVKSGQKDFASCATAEWKTETAQARMDDLISSYYADGTKIDAVMCSNDSTALGVENSLAQNYNGGNQPIITGQDCDKPNVKNMIAGKQSMSVFKDTRELAKETVKMVGQILSGSTVDTTEGGAYNNGKIDVPTYLCTPVFADASNYKQLLIDSGYYTEADLA